MSKGFKKSLTRTPGNDTSILSPDKKFPINLICNDDLEPSTSANNRSVYTRWVRDGSGFCNLYVNHRALEVLEDTSDLPKFIWLLESREIIPDQYKFIEENYDFVASRVDGIFTCDQRLTHEAGPDGKFLYCSLMLLLGSWIEISTTSASSSQWSHLTKDILWDTSVVSK